MSDPLQPVNAGEISPFIGSARTVNAVLEAARRFREHERGGAGESPALDPISAACVVFVRNDTGATLSEFSVVKLGEPIISASDAPFAFQSQPIFPGTTPSAETDAFAVLQEPLAADGIGRAVVLGVAVVNVDFTSASHEYAKPGASNAVLDSATSGPAKILWSAGASGTQRCVVLLFGEMGGEGASSANAWKQPVRVATTANGTLSTAFANGQTVDGVTLATGDRILLKNQTDSHHNGIYTVNASGVPTRATDADTADLITGATVAVTEGAVNADTVWICTANATITVGSTSLPWKRFGDVFGPSSATDNAIARYDSTTGKLIQNSAATIDDSGNVIAASFLANPGSSSNATYSGTSIEIENTNTYASVTLGVPALNNCVVIKSSSDGGTTSDGYLILRGTSYGIVNYAGLTQLGVDGVLPDGTVVWGGIVTSIGTGGGGGSGTVTSVGLTGPAAGITVSGSPITTSGAFTLTLANDLAALEGLSGTGIAGRTGADTWTLYTFDTDTTLAADSDTRVATQKAVKAYVDAAGGATVAGSDKQVQYNDGGVLGAEAGFEYDKTTDTLTVPAITVTQEVVLSGECNPSTITVSQNDYSPSGLADCFTLNLVTSGAVNITGIATGATGRLLCVKNIGTAGPITLKADSVSSSSANRIAGTNDVILPQHGNCLLHYDDSRWRVISTAGAIASVAHGGTGADLSATGGSGQYVKQASAGGAFTVGTIPAGDYPTFVAAGGSAAKGAVPAPNSTAKPNQPRLLGDDGNWIAHTGKYLAADYVATSQTTTSATPADLATAQSMTFTLDEAGAVLIFATCTASNNTAGGLAIMHVDVDGSDTEIARMTSSAAGRQQQIAGVFLTGSLSAGSHTIKLQFSAPSNTAAFVRRQIVVLKA